jgi:hypothetical protein
MLHNGAWSLAWRLVGAAMLLPQAGRLSFAKIAWHLANGPKLSPLAALARTAHVLHQVGDSASPFLM